MIFNLLFIFTVTINRVYIYSTTHLFHVAVAPSIIYVAMPLITKRKGFNDIL
jgi:hypothetical protein